MAELETLLHLREGKQPWPAKAVVKIPKLLCLLP
jgi:hypothetical protein